ncbi:unnamed protein product [Caenorhabditis sp. 36 PRJEB53466]|nr:unnamed protein product [Caenorhabditis sp. 36 PRJEB53466]
MTKKRNAFMRNNCVEAYERGLDWSFRQCRSEEWNVPWLSHAAGQDQERGVCERLPKVSRTAWLRKVEWAGKVANGDEWMPLEYKRVLGIWRVWSRLDVPMTFGSGPEIKN